MYARSTTLPEISFFLFGPRATGKSTWLRQNFKDAYWKNLLLDDDYLPLLGNGSLFREEVEALPPSSWVVVDEVQRIPSLLNEVHDLIARYGDRYRFALSGSSARKLRRMDVNLLAGRVIERKMFPFTSEELGSDFNLTSVLAIGTLPSVWAKKRHAVDILSAYVGTYLKQEIQQEALTENLGAFNRFLKIASLMNGEIINVSNVAREASVARTTVERYFDILVDTLIGFRLPAWQPKLKVRERSAPKFYFFDTGVVRSINGRLRDRVSDLEVGKLLETFILHELRAAAEYQNSGGEFYYWRSGAGAEIDFVWERGDKVVAIEIKNSSNWRRENGRALRDLMESRKESRCFGVFRGKNAVLDGKIKILPVEQFLKMLHGGQILE